MVYMFLADGFEEVEALTPLDLLIRAGADIKTVGIGNKLIRGAHGINVYADLVDSELTSLEADMIILPGGMPGTLNLSSSETVRSALNLAASKGSFIAAICAAPSILGEMGLLEGKNAVCFPGFEDSLKSAFVSDRGVVTDGNVITAAGMGVAFDFGIALIKALYGETRANEIFESTQAHRH